MIAWTVTASGGALSGQVLAPAAGRRGLFGEWRQAPGPGDATETPSGTGAAIYLHARGVRGGGGGQRHRDRLHERGEQPVTGFGGPDAAEAGQGQVPAGLLEKLMAAVRPEFRAGVLTFDPRDPVSGGPPCAVPGCERPARIRNTVLEPPPALARRRASRTWSCSRRPPARTGPGAGRRRLARSPAATTAIADAACASCTTSSGEGGLRRHQRLAAGPGLRAARAAARCLRGPRL